MDIGAFSEDDFNTKEWINNILKSLEQKDKKENHTMSLVMKLQLYVQQVNAALEQTSQQVLVSLPKIMRDTENLQQEAASLKEKLNIVKDEIIKIESDTGQSLQTLENLDTIKTQLTEAKQGLHESDNWTVLANDLEEVFDSRDVNTIATKLLGMQQSLKLLINVADYEDRKMQLEGLKNRLEAIASPAVVLAFTSNNVEESLMYVHIFSSIERLSQLLKYYHKCQKDILLKKWRNQLEIEQDESITQWLHNYYDILLSNWHTQSKWISRVFPNESSTDCLIDIYVDVLTSLDPTVKECVDAALKQVSDKLGLLYEVKQITKQFATNISNIVDKTCKEKLLPLLQAIYDPLISYISKYAAYEQASLMQKLSSVKCIKDELPDTIQALGLSVSTITDAAQDAKTRCKNITENCGYCGLLIALRAFFLNYSDQYKITLRQIERKHW
uniref:Conserved oligomeric Golgi complex subunit 7 n=1 Tax=Photinus pyralis TaxID=7054 RepID=A0A1Y1MHR1_PHOPY